MFFGKQIVFIALKQSLYKHMQIPNNVHTVVKQNINKKFRLREKP